MTIRDEQRGDEEAISKKIMGNVAERLGTLPRWV